MPDPQRLLRTIRKAALAFRATPGRRGRVVFASTAEEVLVAGDLHGNVENFRGLLHKADLARNPRRHFVVQELVHGPYRYPDGGDQSHRLVDLVAALKVQYPDRVHYLLGNHELSQATSRMIGKGDEDFNETFIRGVHTAYGEAGNEVYAAYEEMFSACPLVVRTANRIYLSHSLPPASKLEAVGRRLGATYPRRPTCCRAVPSIRSSESRHVRKRPPHSLAKVDADLLLTGHIPNDRGFDVPNDRQVILDARTERRLLPVSHHPTADAQNWFSASPRFDYRS
jgi:hypothetical protein